MLVRDVIARLPSPNTRQLIAPEYRRNGGIHRLGFAVEEMRRHMTDEGWQLFDGLAQAGYFLCGKNLGIGELNVRTVLEDIIAPHTVVLQDKREWDPSRLSFRDHSAAFDDVKYLRTRDDVFKLTVLKDSHQRPEYHRASADEIGCHAWIVYYHPDIVKHLAPYVRREHLIRTYHSVDANAVPAFDTYERSGCLLSGAVSAAYPLRARLFRQKKSLPDTEVLKHPGYHANGSCTPAFLHTLSRYKVAICTASRYGYLLRKIIEAVHIATL